MYVAKANLKDAARKLEAYVATGNEGFKTQGLDRMQAEGIRIDGYRSAGKAEIYQLLYFLSVNYGV